MRTNTVSFDKKTVRMVAHRGCSGLERENSNTAFIAAGNRSYYGIETDVHVTLDGKLILIHDDRTGRVAERDVSVEGSRFDELRALYLSDLNGAVGRTDLHLPTPEEYIDTCRRYDKVAVLELKNRIPKEKISELLRLFEERDYLGRAIIISFSYENLVDVRALYPKEVLRAQYLTGEYSDDLIERLQAQSLDLDIHYGALTEERVRALHDAGILVNCWTVDNPADGERLAAWDVDFITSNILE